MTKYSETKPDSRLRRDCRLLPNGQKVYKFTDHKWRSLESVNLQTKRFPVQVIQEDEGLIIPGT
jgi:hypothetical protein